VKGDARAPVPLGVAGSDEPARGLSALVSV
jgi:hypothetical protein